MKARESRLQARHEVLYVPLIFVVGQLLLGLWIEFGLPAVRDPDHEEKRVRLTRVVEESAGKPLLLFLGSSRGMMGFRPDLLDPEEDGVQAFNHALLGAGPIVERTVLQRLLADGVRPAAVVVEVVPVHLLQGLSSAGDELRAAGPRFNAHELPDVLPYCEKPQRVLKHWGRARFYPAHWHRKELQEQIGLDRLREEWGPNPMDRFGWFARPRGPEWESLTASSVTYFAPAYACPAANPREVQALRDLLVDCRSRNIVTAVVLMPEAGAFRVLNTPAVEEQLAAIWSSLPAVPECPIIDARTWIPDEEFNDGHHLAPNGAARFTLRFRDEVLPLLRRTQGTHSSAAR